MSIPRSEALRFSKLFTSVYFDRGNNWTASISVLCLSWTQVDAIRKNPINVGLSRRVKKKGDVEIWVRIFPRSRRRNYVPVNE